ncbi:hypothetical protein AWC15_21695 [Mycobacterium lacus]|nr:hypothetical protein [Mycobacterium lacus]MCV7123501.1 hypothetical protein [Mycobacterium lacus]ORW06432.1 hypothetical protein AWC15_21695 [Mycobacterium lacus]
MPRMCSWPAIVVAAIAAVVAVAALIVALTNSTSAAPVATSGPTSTAAQTAIAQQKLCNTYKLAARAVQVETTGTDRALARIALTNAAALLDNATLDPALDSKHRDAARALATAYRTTTAMGSVATDAEYRTALDDIIAKDAVMRQVCANGGG